MIEDFNYSPIFASRDARGPPIILLQFVGTFFVSHWVLQFVQPLGALNTSIGMQEW